MLSAPVLSELPPDPRWQFFTDDDSWYTSPWFRGEHQLMIGFGCTSAPWYSPSSRCNRGQGFHHGVDVATPCGTLLTSGVNGTVLASDAPGTPGPAYGTHPLRIRTTALGQEVDILVAHAVDVRVVAGERVTPGDVLASASDSGAPDGCHLHLEVRPAGGNVSSAIDPTPWLFLERA